MAANPKPLKHHLKTAVTHHAKVIEERRVKAARRQAALQAALQADAAALRDQLAAQAADTQPPGAAAQAALP